MSNPATECPFNWTLTEFPVRGCMSTSFLPGCDSFTISLANFTYNHVCGKVIGYQKGSTNVFDTTTSSASTLEEEYVDGVSLTHGKPGACQHIWTFSAALYSDDPDFNENYVCECTNSYYNFTYKVPSFVGNNYFCETGNRGPGWTYDVYFNQLLWDSMGCTDNSICCQFNHPPWFCTSLPSSTTDDLELRICKDQIRANEDVVVSLVEKKGQNCSL